MPKALIPLAIFWHPPEAHIVRSFLEAHDINAFIFDDYTSMTHWHLNSAMGGTRLMISSYDYEDAVALIKSTEDIDIELVDHPENEPIASSFLDKIISFGAFLLSGLPLPWHKRKK